MYTDVQMTWSTAALLSSGASTQVCAFETMKTCRTFTITIEKASAADTCVVAIEHARTSTSPFERLGSTAYALASSGGAQSVTVQFNGPLMAIRPYVISKTASTTEIVVSLAGV